MTTSIEDIIRRIVREELERALAPGVEEERDAAGRERQMLTIDQVAALCGIPKKTIYGLRSQTTAGSFAPALKIGGKLRWRPEDVEAWLEAQVQRPAARPPLDLRRP